MMRLSDLHKLREPGPGGAPSHGQMLIYTRDKVFFQSYSTIDEVENAVGECSDILELHLFDSTKEYRALSSTSYRAKSSAGIIEYIADFPYAEANVFAENQMLEMSADFGNPGGIIRVLNHISYDESGMAAVDDYRMVMGGVD